MGGRLYRTLVRLMPASFRREYGDEMCRVAEDQWAEREPYEGYVGAWLFWGRESVALLRAAAGLHRRENETGGMTMDGFRQDLKHAARALMRRPGFSALTIVTLALGIGATTSIFSAVHTVIIQPLPYAGSEDVTVLFRASAASGERSQGVSAANVRDLREGSSVFSALAVAEPWSLDLRQEDRTISLRTWSVSRGFFEAIGGQAMLGRTVTEADYDEGNSNIVVLSHREWLNRFNADPDIVGQTLALDGDARTVVGVMPSDFRFPDAAAAWIPRLDQPWDGNSRAADYLTGVGRLRDGASRAQAEAEFDQLAATLTASYPNVNDDLAYDLVPLREYLIGSVRTPLFVLMAAVGFVLLIACANVAGLMLARGAQRERDYALRGALGAGTGRLMGHVVAESLILAVAGCALGVFLTFGGVAVIRALGPEHLPRIDELRVDGSVLLFAAGAAALSAVLSALAPSWRLSRPNLRDALGDGSRGSGGGRFETKARSRLVVTQVAAAVVLLVGAGLLMRSFSVLLDEELGFNPNDRVALQIFAYDYESPEDQQAVVQQAVDEMRALPGVTGVGITTNLPSSTDGVIANIEITVPFTIADRAPPPAGQEPITAISQVNPDYFDVMEIDVVDGRDISDSDNADGTPVIMINEALARRHFGDGSPVGERLTVSFGQNPVAREIVGVVADTRPTGHASEPRPEVYYPLAQLGSGSLTFVVAGTGDAGALIQPATEAVWAANPAQSVYGAMTVDALLGEWLKERRFNLFLLTAFSAIALVLSAIGIYGLVSFSVERRMGELGIRRALGGQSSDLMGMVVGQGARLAATGLAIGMAAAWYLSRFIQGMLYEVAPTDPATFVGLGLLIFVIAAVSTLLPAMRAMKVDPVEALRSE
ncbi:MAG: ABC transporter permease [Gemmatimonadota bacterium]